MKKMSEKQLKKLKSMKEKDIDFSDIPEIKDSKKWKRLYPNTNKNEIITNKMIFDALTKVMEQDESEKIPVTLKLDRQVVAFFKEHSKKYQTKINEILVTFVTTYKKSHCH